ncbi:MAG: formate/nitrite transporter family protein [Candidatus Eremiobacteraeota bacterium]|nr:formate/nitrite transporter family protein [Candidatus Eremiobacteraeota bacterium]
MASTSGSTVELSEDEEREVDKRSPPRAAVVFETIRREGETELRRPVFSLALSGLAAGLSMGASLAGEGLIRSMLPDAQWRPLAVSFGYTLGFLIVVIGRQQLFTENTITAILPLLDDKDKGSKLLQVLRLWSVVLLANIAGAAAFAFAAAHTSIFSAEVRTTFGEIAREAVAPGFGSILLRGIASGWLIALMVWMLPGADTNRPLIVLIVTYFVGLGSFSHIIAGSVEAIYLVAIGGLSWAGYLGGFLLPVFIGNVIGGTSLVALLNYGQVVAEN